MYIKHIGTNSMVADPLTLAPTVFHEHAAHMGVVSKDAFDQWELIFSFTWFDICIDVMTSLKRFYEVSIFFIILL